MPDVGEVLSQTKKAQIMNFKPDHAPVFTILKRGSPCRLILHEVSGFYLIEPEHILGRKQIPPVVRARSVAMYLMRMRTRRSTTAIGNFFGRDHATVIYTVKKIQKFWAEYKDEVRSIQDRLGLEPPR